MKILLPLVLALLSFGASAQGFVDPGPVCYSWEGGHKSSGSFSRCNPELQPAKPRAVVQALPPPVLPSPVMMPQSAPITCAPPPKPLVKHKRPPPKKC